MGRKEVHVNIEADAKAALAELQKASEKVQGIAKAMQEAGTEAQKAGDKISKAGKAGGRFSASITRASDRATAGLKGVQDAAAGIGAAFAATGAAKIIGGIVNVGLAAVKSAAQMKQYEIAFTTMLRSQEKGAQMLEDLQKFAQVTPFDVPGVVEAGQKLMAFGFQADEVISTLTTLGDAAAGLGKGSAGVSQMAYALGQMKSAGTLKTEDINMLVNAGVGAWQMLADASGKSVQEIKDMTSKGLIDGGKAVEVFLAGMNQTYGGMMDKTAKEITGLWANVAVGVSNFAADFGDSLAKALNVKGALTALGDAIVDVQNKFSKAKKEGQSFGQCIRAAVPTPVLMALGGLGGLLAGVVVVGFLAATKAAIGFAVAQGIALGPIAAVAVAVGALAALVATHWDEVRAATKVAWRNICNYVTIQVNTMVGTVLKAVEQITYAMGQIGRALHFDTSAIDGLHDMVDQKQLSLFKEAADRINEMGDTAKRYQDELKNMRAENLAPATGGGEAPEVDTKPKKLIDLSATGGGAPSTGGGGGGRAVGGGVSTAGINMGMVSSEISGAMDATKGLGAELSKIGDQVSMDSIKGGDRVYAEIQAQKNERIKAIDEALDKQRAAVNEAAEIRAKAEATGNADLIAQAQDVYSERTALLADSEGKALELRERTLQQAKEKASAFNTQIAAARAEIDEAMNASTMAGFYATMDEQKAARMQALEEEQNLRQQYVDWLMESESTILDFSLEAAETFKTNLASGIADCITEGKKFGDVIKNLGKQIANMFVQWVVNRQMASVMNKLFAGKDAATTAAAASAAAAAWTPAAIAYETVHPGSAARAAVSVNGAMAAGNAIKMGEGISATGFLKQRANGGYTPSGWTLVGERGPELVNFGQPSRVYTAAETSKALSGAYATPDTDGAGGVTATLNNYGDINNAADLFDLLNGFGGVVAAGARGY